MPANHSITNVLSPNFYVPKFSNRLFELSAIAKRVNMYSKEKKSKRKSCVSSLTLTGYLDLQKKERPFVHMDAMTSNQKGNNHDTYVIDY